MRGRGFDCGRRCLRRDVTSYQPLRGWAECRTDRGSAAATTVVDLTIMVLILADFPNEHTRHEGMAQRILAVDRQLESVDRQYLFVSHRRFFRKQVEPVAGSAIQYRYNLFAHFFSLLKLLRSAPTIYVHSVINLLPILPLFPWLNKTTFVVLDAHGIVPEEQQLAGRLFKSNLYALAERMV